MWSKILAAITYIWLSLFNFHQPKIITPKADIVFFEPTITPQTRVTAKITPEIKIKPTLTPQPLAIADTTPWGIAQQIDEHTWQLRIQMDEKMATANEVLTALNEYRRIHGSGPVAWDERLANYALERAKYFTSIKNVDKHQGFEEKLKDEQGFRDLGFWSLGENASYGYRLEAVHLIEWMYAADKDHNQNQLEPRWTHVGIGIDGVATCLIFGKDKI